MLLELNDIKKSFGEVAVLKGIDLTLKKGEVLGLIGENGAGKSTLMNILGGIFKSTSGSTLLEGEPYEPSSPIEAQASGLSFIHQELNLFPNLTIAENLFINQFPKKKTLGISRIDKGQIKEKTKESLKLVGLNLDPDTLLESLSPAQQQMVEIAKALSSDPKVIIFDEPTTSLSRHEVSQLFELITELKGKGIAMIYISHNLDDVIALSDNIAVLRDGELVCQGAPDTFTIESLVKEMVGREMADFFPLRNTRPTADAILKVESLSAKGFVNDISFDIHEQEVVGFYGLVGAGRSELARIIFGLDDYQAGSMLWKGEKISAQSPASSIKNGLAFLTEDRREEGLLLGMNLERNAQLASLKKYASNFLNKLDRKSIGRAAAEKIEATKTKHNNLTEQLVSTLSGGNQQKVVLSKWLMTDPELLILDEPTKGIDIGAKREIYGLMNDLVVEGSSIMMISSEIEELLGMCDRIIVMSEGWIKAEFKKEEFDRDKILEAALHKKLETA